MRRAPASNGVMRMRAVLGIALIVFLNLSRGLAVAPAADGPPKEDGFTVHEWGVFTFYASQAFANAGCDEVWKDLPPEVFGITPGRRPPGNPGGNRGVAKKPLVYFYNLPRKFLERVEVQVDFPGGTPLVWYPKTSAPYARTDGGPTPILDDDAWGHFVRGRLGQLKWSLNFPSPDKVPALYCPAFVWKEAVLQPEALLFVPFVEDEGAQLKSAKFLFYEGLLPNRNGVVLREEKTDQGARYFLGNAGASCGALDVWVIEKTAAKLSVGRLDKLPVPGKIRDLPETELKLDIVADGAEGAAKVLTAQLIAAGLFRAEAEGLVAIWKKEFFETPGLHVLYRLPQDEYDRMLPLQIKPEPQKIVRAGLAWLPHLETDLKERVAGMVKQLGDETFEKREEAYKALQAIGPASMPFLQAEHQSAKDAEIKNRLSTLMEAYTLDPEKHLGAWRKLLKKEK